MGGISGFAPVATIVGYNIGAGRYERAKGLFTRLLIAEACVGTAAFLIVEFFPRQLLGIFGAANESIYYMDFGLRAFRIYLSAILLACINKAAFIYLQSLGRPWASTFLSLLREVVFGVGFALVLPLFLGLDGVLYSMPASDILTFIASSIVIAQTYKSLGKTALSKKQDTRTPGLLHRSGTRGELVRQFECSCSSNGVQTAGHVKSL
jgi:Na+-driven multidrug efflux pump